ncbi:hypothetical protein FKM82_024410 [Ascaphus truei]
MACFGKYEQRNIGHNGFSKSNSLCSFVHLFRTDRRLSCKHWSTGNCIIIFLFEVCSISLILYVLENKHLPEATYPSPILCLEMFMLGIA